MAFMFGVGTGVHCTKIKFSIKDFLNKSCQIRRFLRIWPHLTKISLMENFIFCTLENIRSFRLISLKFRRTGLNHVSEHFSSNQYFLLNTHAHIEKDNEFLK